MFVFRTGNIETKQAYVSNPVPFVARLRRNFALSPPIERSCSIHADSPSAVSHRYRIDYLKVTASGLDGRVPRVWQTSTEP